MEAVCVLSINGFKRAVAGTRPSDLLSCCASITVLTKLIWDLQSFLSALDSENLSYIAQAQKKSISELLFKLQTRDSPGTAVLMVPL